MAESLGILTFYGTAVSNIISGEVRSMYVMGDYLYVIVGDALYKIDRSLNRSFIGTLDTSQGKAWIVGDGTNIATVDGHSGYCYKGTTWAKIDFPDNFRPSSLTFQDGYFIVSRKNMGRFYISTLYEPAAWDALDYATAEGQPDNLQCVYSHNRDLWLLGEQSTEIWYNSGAAAFPFERYQGGSITVGCKAPRSLGHSDEQLFWLDNDLRVRMGIGVQSEIISTPQIEYQIAQLSDFDNAVGFYYCQEGHGFYQLTIADETFCFDVSTGYWHKRASGAADHRHPAQCYAWYDNKHLVGHYNNGKILEFDYDTYTNNGETFRAIRSAQVIHHDRKRVFHNRFEVEFEAGVGNTDCLEPEAVLDWSDDEGHTFGTDYTADIGSAGAYTTRAIWRRLGNARSRVYRVIIDDPVKRVIIGAHLEAIGSKS